MTRMVICFKGKLVPIVQNTYDSHGSVLEVKNLDKDGNIINSPDNGVAITQYKYDEAGNRTETITLNKDKVPVKV